MALRTKFRPTDDGSAEGSMMGPEDPATLPTVNQFNARACSDGIYRNRWGCHYCSVEGCGLVSDMVLGGKEVCVFHAAAQRCPTEMTEVLHKYQPLIILAKAYDKTSDVDRSAADGEKPFNAASELFEQFRTLVEQSRFNLIPYYVSDDEGYRYERFKDVPLPLRRSDLKEGQQFVSPITYVHLVCLMHATAIYEEKKAQREKLPRDANPEKTKLAKLSARIKSLGATWEKKKTKYDTAGEWF